MSVAAASPAFTPLARVLHRAAEAIRPDPLLPVSGWADEFRVLDTNSARPGKWETDYAPHTREPMNRLSRQDLCQLLVLMWAAQTAKTSVILNAIGHHIHTSPRPMMAVQPTQADAEDFSKTHLEPMFATCPELRARVSESKSRTDASTMSRKHFPGGFLRLAIATAATSLRRIAVGDLFLDEVDGYPANVDDEGDPVSLARKRLTTFKRTAKTVLTSTPTVKGGSRIETAIDQTDYNEWWVPCPHCGEWWVPKWRTKAAVGGWEYRVQWPKGKPQDAVYVCEANGCIVQPHERLAAYHRGEWRPRDPDKARGGLVHGYHFPAVFSPFVELHTLAEEWDDADGDPVQLRTFINTRLAETWDDAIGGTVKSEGLLARREPYVVVPRNVVVITGAIDVQDDRLELHLVGWGADWESWAIDYVVLGGSPGNDAVWLAADVHLRRTFATEDGRTLTVAAACVDTGASAAFAGRAAMFCQGRDGRHVWAIKGATAPEAQIWPKRPGKTKTSAGVAVPLYTVGVGQCKTEIYDRLPRKPPGPGAMHFPERWPTSGHECDAAYFEQLTAERLVWKNRKRRWVKRHEGVRNEALDLWVYCYAALHGLIRLGLRLPRAAPQVEAAASTGPAPTQTSPTPPPAPTPAPPPVAPPQPRPPQRPPHRRPSVHSRPPRSLW